MEEAYKDGKVRAIGVSNFMQHHLEALLETAEIVPHVNQILLAPGCAQEDLVAYCQERDILLEAYSPLGTGSIFGNEEVEAVLNVTENLLHRSPYVGAFKKVSCHYLSQ